MAEKNYKKSIELLRLLILEGKALKNKEIAEKLGMSESTLQKTVQEVNLMMYHYDFQLMDEGQPLQLIRRKIEQRDEAALYTVFVERDSSYVRRLRESAVLQLLYEQPNLTYTGIKNALMAHEDEHLLLEENQIKRLIKDLLKEGLITAETVKEGKLKKTYFAAKPFFSLFPLEHLKALREYLLFCQHNTILSSIAYTVRLKLEYYFQKEVPSTTAYPYTYMGRALDDPLVYLIMEAVLQGRLVELQYSKVTLQRKFISNTSDQIETKFVTPLHLVYDAIYSRWYLLATASGKRLQTFRIDYIKQVKLADQVMQPKKLIGQMKQQLAQSWNVSSRPLEHVQIRFYQYETDFILRRVQQQGHNGCVIEMYEDGFLWEVYVRGTDEIIPWIRSFGSSAEVISPQALRDEMKKQWQQLEEFYDSYSSI